MNRVEHSPEATLTATRIIALALMAGVLSTSGVVIFLVNNPVIPIQVKGNTVSQVMAALSAINLLALAFLSSWGVSKQNTDPLHLVWQRRMVIRFALLEGTALLNAVAYIIERQWWSFGLLVGTLILMAVLFPTRSRFEHFIETHSSDPTAT